MDQELHHELRPQGVEHYRREAKALLRAVRASDPPAFSRAREALGERADRRFVLADALHVVAVEHGHRSWPAFKRATEIAAGDEAQPVGRIGAVPSDRYASWADGLLAAARRGEPEAVERLRSRVPRRTTDDDRAIAERATAADARICLAREYGFRTWAELADAADRAHETHYSRLPDTSPWKRAEAAINTGDAAKLREVLHQHPGLEHEDPGGTLLGAAAQPEAGRVPREAVDVLIEAGSELDVPLNLAACFDKADMVGWLLDAGADAAAVPIWGITPLQTAIYHGSREAADVLIERVGLLPDALYVAAAADDIERLTAWFDAEGRLRPEAMRERPNLSDVGWPPRPPMRDDPADVLAEALSLAAQLGRTRACEELLDRGADAARTSSHPRRRSPSRPGTSWPRWRPAWGAGRRRAPGSRAASHAGARRRRPDGAGALVGIAELGLVNVPVQLFSAVRDLDVHFRQLHEKDGAPIETRRFCADEDRDGAS